MKIRTKLLLMLPLALMAACSQPTPEDQTRIDEIDVGMETKAEVLMAIVDTIATTSPHVAKLIQGSVDGTNTAEEAAELAAILTTGPENVREAANEASEIVANLWSMQKEKTAIREKTGGGWWEDVGAYVVPAGISYVLGMGLPTSGPLAPLFAWLAPLLEKTPLRNKKRRAVVRSSYDKP